MYSVAHKFQKDSVTKWILFFEHFNQYSVYALMVFKVFQKLFTAL